MALARAKRFVGIVVVVVVVVDAHADVTERTSL